MALSSKIVPTLTENCFRQPRQVHSIRVWINDTVLPSHLGHCGPLGHFALDTVSRQTTGSEKYRITASKPLFFIDLTSSMAILCRKAICESSDMVANLPPCWAPAQGERGKFGELWTQPRLTLTR